MKNKFSLRQYKRKYGTHEQCLEAIKRLRFPDEMDCPKCKRLSVFYPVRGRTAYACKFCGYQIYPLATTVFEKTSTPLDLWFFAMYLMVQTRSGISARQLERMLGVTYKTAWRICRQIRLLMAEASLIPLTGTVEADEGYIGGNTRNRKRKWFKSYSEQKQIILGMVQRGGKAYLRHIPDSSRYTIINQIKHYVSPKTRVITDQFSSYVGLAKYGYQHDTVNHQETYVVKDIHTQNAECLWSTIKRGLFGVYRVVSKKYLQAYIDEYAWRYNYRNLKGMMFEKLLSQVIEVKAIQPASIK
ncbi:IS1595 family transposase [Candidatus Gottesmanbacteria bacterium]|nr:IS1595 family transposase [Candidatus Gottesmanbacteria bacterium]